jgi:hypothetical protein
MENQGIRSANLGGMEFMKSAIKGDSEKEENLEMNILFEYFRQCKIPPEQMAKILKQAVDIGTTFSRKNKTVIALRPLNPHDVQIYYFSIDEKPQFLEAVKHSIKELKKVDVGTIYLNKEDPTIVKLLEEAGLKMKKSDYPEFKLKADI